MSLGSRFSRRALAGRRCALLYAGPASFLSHNTAAYVQGLRVRPTDLVHLTIPHTQHPRSHGFVVVHQSQRPCRLERNGDLRWSEPTRTVLDVAGTLLTRDDVRAWSPMLCSVAWCPSPSWRQP